LSKQRGYSFSLLLLFSGTLKVGLTFHSLSIACLEFTLSPLIGCGNELRHPPFPPLPLPPNGAAIMVVSANFQFCRFRRPKEGEKSLFFPPPPLPGKRAAHSVGVHQCLSKAGKRNLFTPFSAFHICVLSFPFPTFTASHARDSR